MRSDAFLASPSEALRRHRARPELTDEQLALHFSHVLHAASTLNEAAAGDFFGATFATSLSAEDMVITDMIVQHQLEVDFVVLRDCAPRPRTLNFIACIAERYGREFRVVCPSPSDVVWGTRPWITSARREQSQDHADVARHSFDATSGQAIYSPLAEWSSADVWHYLEVNDVPYNALHVLASPLWPQRLLSAESAAVRRPGA